MKSMFTRLNAYRKRVVIMVGIIIGAAGLFAFAPATGVLAGYDLTGVWHCSSCNMDFVITSGVGSLIGRAESQDGKGRVFAAITGSVSGDSVTIITTYNDSSPGYIATFVGKVYYWGDNTTIMDGTWTGNNGRAGGWSAKRFGASASQTPQPPQPPKPQPPPIIQPPDKSQPVAKITQIKEISRNAPTKIEYARGDKWYTAYDGMDIMIGDKLRTDGNTVAAIEFVLGGRVGINKSSVIEIVGEGTVKEIGKPSVKRIIIRQGGMWAKLAKRNDPLEIQTNGGIMGIRDTAGRSTGK
ncbi:hypothetical protein HY250_02850 [Candidatus Azambacteria bacterium]|nr:hypothetical protein [Candidatus Azambacteria bacterium]